MIAYRDTGKRVMDLAISAGALTGLSPLIGLVSVAIVLNDGRPVFFRQQRIGRGGRAFTIWKFRSMRTDTCPLPSADDSNASVTAVGRVIRRTNLDELPQLFNILRGDMSLVGPRAPLASQEKLVRLRTEGGADLVRPGLTGLAQVNAYDGMDDVTKASFDIQYARRVNLALDLALIARTFGYLLKRPPKY